MREILDHDIIPALGSRKVTDITTSIVAAVVDRVVSRGAPTHAGKVLAICKRMFS